MLSIELKLIIVGLLKDCEYQTGIDKDGKPTYNKQLVRVPYSLLWRILNNETEAVNDEKQAIDLFFADYENNDLYFIFIQSDETPYMCNNATFNKMQSDGLEQYELTLFSVEKGEQNANECFDCVLSAIN